jgi:hypothetical protein
MMTPEQAAEEMRRIADTYDEEGGHIEADALMCQILRDLGYGEAMDIFRDMDKWYS